MAINTPDGIVLVVGCSHPGIESIVAEAAKINPHIHCMRPGTKADTLVIYLSDNGRPFPGAKDNLYEPGLHCR